LLREGRHLFIHALANAKVVVQSLREPFIVHEKLDVIVRSGALKDGALVLDLKTASGLWYGSAAASATC
jgi:hypothetical protein